MTFKLDWKRNPRGTSFVVVQSISRVQLFATPWTAAHQASLSSTVFWSLLKVMSIELVMLSNHLLLCHPLLLLPSIFPSIRSFLMNWFFASGGRSIGSFSISPSNEYSGLISFRISWSALLAVPGTLKSLVRGTLSPGISDEFIVLPLQPGLRLWLVTGLPVGRERPLPQAPGSVDLRGCRQPLHPRVQLQPHRVTLASWHFWGPLNIKGPLSYIKGSLVEAHVSKFLCHIFLGSYLSTSIPLPLTTKIQN